jgi:oligopeptide/dipeptide ABC transporter ATP-binding protein
MEVLVDVKGLKKHFPLGRGRFLRAVNGVSFQIYQGETLGFVGESGCGKSTLGRILIQLEKPTAGEIYYRGQSIDELKGKQQRAWRQKVQMIFQDPYASLNPRLKGHEIISEGLVIHRLAAGQELKERVFQLLQQVGLSEEHAERYPHELSGGQRQRMGIARALAVEPECIVADEPISALDASVQAQVIQLLKELQKQHRLTYLFIAHDLAMVKYMSDRIGVMYLGYLMELTTSQQLYDDPLHPYTQSLLAAMPIADPQQARQRERIVIRGEMPNPLSLPTGCPFQTRCPHVMDVCRKEMPSWKEVKAGHWTACYLYD